MPPSTPLLHPQGYFRTTRSSDYLLSAFIVFLGYVIANVVAVYAVARWLLNRAEAAPAGVSRGLADMLPFLVVGVFLVSVVALVVVASIMHLFSGSYADGRYRDAIAVAGWAYAPNVVGLGLQLAWTRYQLRGITFQADHPEAFQAEAEALLGSSGAVDAVIGVGVIAWSVYVLAYGVAATHEVDLRRTLGPALVVGIGAGVLNILF